MTQPKLRRWRLFEPIYMADITLYQGDFKDYAAETKKRWDYEIDTDRPRYPAGQSIEHTRKSGHYYVIWVPTEFSVIKPEDLNTLAHEVFHLTLFVLMTRGLNATKDNHEHYCYFHGWLFEQCWRRLREDTCQKKSTSTLLPGTAAPATESLPPLSTAAPPTGAHADQSRITAPWAATPTAGAAARSAPVPTTITVSAGALGMWSVDPDGGPGKRGSEH